MFEAGGFGVAVTVSPGEPVPAGQRRRSRLTDVLVPAGFGSLPGYVFTKILGIPAFVTPYANPDEANHAPNENLTLDCFYSGLRTGAALLHELGQIEAP